MYKYAIALFLLCTNLAMLSAEEVLHRTKKHNEDAVELSGDILTILVPVVAGFIAYAKDDTEGLKQVTYTGITSTVVTHTFKLLVPAPRPDDPNATNSYVSGHTSFPMGASTFLQIRYGWAYGIPAYLVSAFVGWTRVYSERHHQSDVFRGTLVGVLSGLAFATPYEGATLSFKPAYKGLHWKLSLAF